MPFRLATPLCEPMARFELAPRAGMWVPLALPLSYIGSCPILTLPTNDRSRLRQDRAYLASGFGGENGGIYPYTLPLKGGACFSATPPCLGSTLPRSSNLRQKGGQGRRYDDAERGASAPGGVFRWLSGLSLSVVLPNWVNEQTTVILHKSE